VDYFAVGIIIFVAAAIGYAAWAISR